MTNGGMNNLEFATVVLKFIISLLSFKNNVGMVIFNWKKDVVIDVGFGCPIIGYERNCEPAIRISLTNMGANTVCVAYCGLEFCDKPSVFDNHAIILEPTGTDFEIKPGEKRDVYIVDHQRFFELVKNKAEVKPGMKVYGYAKLANGKRYTCKTRYTYSELKLAWDEYAKEKKLVA